jgi:peptidoglycan/xylan/chitin deacetylase (PgdA/CDA1 family)
MEDEAKKNENKKKKNTVKTVLIILLVCLLSFAAGYAVTASGLGEKAAGAVRQWFERDRSAVPPGDGEPQDPGNGQEPGENPGEPGEDPGKPGDEPGEPGDEPGTPVIYVGQILTIPFQGGGNTGLSQVVHQGSVSSGQGRKQIALTFDSGWLFEQTIPLLNVLDQHGVKATFFPRAGWIADHPELGKEIVRRGHTIGNHSLTHREFTKLSLDEVRMEMRESTRIIKEVTGVRPYMFRPPYGEYYNNNVLSILADEGYPYTVMWTIDTHDWADKMHGHTVDADYIVNRVLNNASDNGIVLMHIGGPRTVEALPRIIEGLRAMDYTFNTVDKMLPPPSAGTVTHTVAAGETLYSIAQRYGVTVQQIIDANNF